MYYEYRHNTIEHYITQRFGNGPEQIGRTPGQRSRFIAESLKERLACLEKREMESQLAEGYRATAQEGVAIAKDFEPADLEGWDEY